MALNINQTQLDSFNKNTTKGRGTLVANWHEESYLRENTGEGRSQAAQHLPKKHHELFHTTTDEYPLFKEVLVNRLDTTTRLFGKLAPDNPPPVSKSYGTTRNPVENIPVVGKRHQMIQQQFLSQLQDEIVQQQQDGFKQTQTRAFSTTNKQEYGNKTNVDVNNTIGKRVMRNQNGNTVQGRDVELWTDHGFYQKPPISHDVELKQQLNGEHYLTAKPVTFYTEKLSHGTFYGSQPIHEERPFHKTDHFAKTYHHFTHVQN